MGYKTNDIISAMPGLLSAAAAGQTDLASTADIVSNVLSGFGMKAGETAKVADVLTKTFTNSNTDLNMLGLTMKYVAPVAKASGQSLESMAAAAGILGNAGIQADSAGTALRMMLIRLAKPPKMAKDALKQLGISVSDSSGKMKPLSQIIGEISNKTANMGQAERLATVAKISGTEASASMLALMDAGQGTIDKFTKSLENSGGAADDIAKKQLDNLNGQIIILKSALEGAAISIGGALMPALKVVTSFIQSFVDKFNGLSDGMKKFIAIGGSLAALFLLFTGPILILISLLPGLIAGFGAIAGVMGLTSAALLSIVGTVALVIAAIVAIGVALVIAYNKIGWFRDMVNAAWAQIISWWNAALTFISGIVQQVIGAVASFIGAKLAEIKAFWAQNGAEISQIAKAAFIAIQIIIITVMGIIRTTFQTVWPIISGIVQIAWALIKSVISTALSLILGIISVALNVLQGNWRGAWNSIKNTASTIMNNIISYFRSINLAQIGKNIIQGLVNGISSMAGAITSKVKQLAKLIPDGLKSFLGIHSPSRVTFALGEFTGDGLINGIQSKIKDMKDAAYSMASAVVPDIPSALATPNANIQVAQLGIDAQASATNANTKPVYITNVLTLDGYEVARQTAPYIDAMQTNQITLNSYMKGDKR